MGASAIPVAGVSAGDQARFGTPEARNSSASVFAEGLSSSVLGFQHAVYQTGQVAATLPFAFEHAYEKPSTSNVAFTFGGVPLTTGVGVGDAALFGSPGIRNAAASVGPVGFDSQVCGRITAWRYTVNAGATVDFPFTETYAGSSPFNVPFGFGGQIVVAGVTAGAQGAFGVIKDITTALQARPVGIPAGDAGRARVGSSGGVDFSFVDGYARPPTENAPFYFGSGLAVAPSAGLQSSFGVTGVRNAAASLTPSNFGEAALGRPAAFFAGQNGAGVDFVFAQSYSSAAPLNVPFYFAGVIGVNVGSIGSLAFGVPFIRNLVEVVRPDGIALLIVGDHTVAKSTVITQECKPRGFEDSVFGTADLSPRFVYPASLTLPPLGTAVITQTLATQFVRPGSFTSYKVGEFLKIDPRFIYLFGWVSSTVGGHNFAPNPTPVGIAPPDMGLPRVDDGKQFVDPVGVDAPEEFFPVPDVKGHWEYVEPVSIDDGGIFGDVRVRNKELFVVTKGADSLEFPNYQPVVYNARFVAYTFGIPATLNEFARPAVRNAADSFTPAPIDSLVVGDATDVGHRVRTLNTELTVMTEWGLPRVKLGAAIVAPEGMTGVVSTLGLVAYGVRYINVDGKDYNGLGKQLVVDYKTIPIQDVGGIAGSSYGTLRIESSIRGLIIQDGIAQDVVSTPRVSFGIQTITPVPIAQDFSWEYLGGDLRVEYALKYTTPKSWDSQEYGTAEVVRNEVIVAPEGLKGAVGVPHVEWSRRYLDMGGMVAKEFGTPWVSPSPRIITHYHDSEEIKYGTAVGTAYVESFFKTITAYGWWSSRFGSGTSVLYNAVLVGPEAIDSLEITRPLVAERVRYIAAEGHDSQEFTRWTVVLNHTQQIEPNGIGRPYAGVPYIWSNTQWVDLYGSDNDHLEVGTSMVAYAIRDVSLSSGSEFSSFAIPPGDFGDQYVGLFTQYVVPLGKDYAGVGDAVFEEKHSVVHPWGAMELEFGVSEIKNATPQLFAVGFEDGEYSKRHAVAFYTRTIDLNKGGIAPWTVFPPKPLVKDRTITAEMTGIPAPAFTRLHDVRGDYPEVAPRQLIFVEQIPKEGVEQNAGPGKLVGMPGVYSNNIYVSSQEDAGTASVFGTARVRLQGCRPFWDWPDSQWTFGTPAIVHPQKLENVGLQPVNHIGAAGLNPHTLDWLTDSAGGIGLIVFGAPRITPHTIWCGPAPKQAIDNHAGSYFIPVDRGGKGRIHEPTEDVQFGDVVLSLKSNRSIQHHTDSGYGYMLGDNVSLYAGIQNLRRTVYMDGVSMCRFGFPELPTNAEIFAGNIKPGSFGTPNLAIELVVVGLEAKPEGWDSSAIPKADVSLSTRYLLLEGMRAPRIVMGGNLYPSIYHYGRGFTTISGTPSSEFGEPGVSPKNRAIQVYGAESFISEYTPSEFALRMTVRHLTTPMGPSGSDSAEFGVPAVRLHVLKIGPYQIERPRCMGHHVHVAHKE